jgi:uncharacterized repeat protein (TIGR01451 family)
MEGSSTVGSIPLSFSGFNSAKLFAATTDQAFTSVVLTVQNVSGVTGFAIAQPRFSLANANPSLSKTVINPAQPSIVNPTALVQVNPGGTLQYSLTVNNTSPSTGNDAIGAVVTDTLPANTVFQSAPNVPSGWTESDPGVGNPGTVQFTNPLLPHGASATFTINVTVVGTTPTSAVINDAGSASSSDSTTVASNTASATVVGPNLTFTGNNFRIQRDGTTPAFIDITTDGNLYSQLASTIQNITLNGLPPGNGQVGDNLTIDDSNGLVTNNPPSAPVTTPLTISYLGNPLRVNQLILQQPSGTTLPANSQETVDVGANSGAGADLITSDGSTANTQEVFFANVNSFFTSVPKAGFNVLPSPTGIPTSTISASFTSVLATSLLNGGNNVNYTEGAAPGNTALNPSWGRVTADSFASLNFRN